jgi:hypothetical protein
MYSLITDEEKRILKWDGTVEEDNSRWCEHGPEPIRTEPIVIKRQYKTAPASKHVGYKARFLQNVSATKCDGTKTNQL